MYLIFTFDSSFFVLGHPKCELVFANIVDLKPNFENNLDFSNVRFKNKFD